MDPEARLRADGSTFTVHLPEATAAACCCHMYECADVWYCCTHNIDATKYALVVSDGLVWSF